MRNVASRLCEQYSSRATDAVYLCYNAPLSAIAFEGQIEKFLPLDPAAMGVSEGARIGREYIFEPSREEVLAQLVPRYCESKLYAALAEALTAEHSARMLAMNNATRNCEELIDTLTLRMNKARQAAITKEIGEIMGGAEALRK